MSPETIATPLPASLGLSAGRGLRALWLAAAVAAAAAAIPAALGAESVPAATAKAGAPGQPLPALNGFSLEGEIPATAGKVVLVDFWASWCVPCKVSFPALGELQKQFAERGLVVVGVSVDENLRAYAKFLEKQKPPFAVVRDAGQRLAAVLDPAAMPTSYLVDRRGVIRFVHEGFHGKSSIDSYTKEIEQLLAEPAP